MGSLESLFSQSNEVHLPGEKYEGQARRRRQTAGSPHSTLDGEKRRDGQDDSDVMTLTLSVNKTTRSGQLIANDGMSVCTCAFSGLPCEVKRFAYTCLIS